MGWHFSIIRGHKQCTLYKHFKFVVVLFNKVTISLHISMHFMQFRALDSTLNILIKKRSKINPSRPKVDICISWFFFPSQEIKLNYSYISLLHGFFLSSVFITWEAFQKRRCHTLGETFWKETSWSRILSALWCIVLQTGGAMHSTICCPNISITTVTHIRN